VFAIAMTLLALDLKVPDLAGDATESRLRHALAANGATYLSYLLTFYVLASYWSRHRRLLRQVGAVSDGLIARTLALLLLVGAMPFFSSLLGEHGPSAWRCTARPMPSRRCC
jgi:uncharacterized membrane protein